MHEVVSNLHTRRQRAVEGHAAPAPAGCDADLQYGRIDEILGDRAARLPDAVPRAGQRPGRRHQPRLPRARRGHESGSADSRLGLAKAPAMSIHVALNHVTHYTLRPADPPRPAGRAAAPGAAFAHAHPQLLDAGRADHALRQLAAGPAVELPGAARLPKVTTFVPGRGRPRRRDGGAQPVRFLPRAVAPRSFRSATTPELLVELEPYLLKGPATPQFVEATCPASTSASGRPAAS